MASQISFWFLMAFFICFICSSHAATLEVGDDDGWTLNPTESYTAWSGRLRFLVNDTLYFKYDDATDSVLVVDKDDYDTCNVDNPIEKLDGGDSSYRLEKPGANYFITGNKSNCDQGQKLDVEVLHMRVRSPPSPPPAPSPALPPAPASPVPLTPPTATPVMTPPAAAPTGGSSLSPVGSNPADLNPPPPSPSPSATPSSATTCVSGTLTASLVTFIIALCSII